LAQIHFELCSSAFEVAAEKILNLGIHLALAQAQPYLHSNPIVCSVA